MRTRLRSLAPAFACLLLLAACDKKEEKKADKSDKAAAKEAEPAKKTDEPAKEATPPEPTKAADVLVLGAAKLKAKDKPDMVIEIAADGTVTAAGEVFLKVSTDGKFSGPDGAAVGQVGADGVVTFDGKPAGVTLIEGGATVTTPDGKTATLKFAEDGSVTVDPKPEQPVDEMTSEGCTGPVAKTCALVMINLLFRSEPSPDAPPAKVEAPAEPAAG